MRFVVLGAGAIGGAVGGRLFQQGFDVTLVARGEHGRALRSGLVLEDPKESVTLPDPGGRGRRRGVVGGRCGRRRRRAPRRQGPAHRSGAGPAHGCVGARHDAHRLHAERGRERAARATPLPAHLRHVRDVSRQPAASRRGPGALGSRLGPARPRVLSPRGRRAGASHRRRDRQPPPSSPWRARTSCAGSTASSS